MSKPISISPPQFLIYAGAVFFLVLFFLIYGAALPPASFPQGTIFDVPKDASLSQTSAELVQKGIIRSAFLFKAAVVLFHGEKGILAGDYVLYSHQNALEIAYRMVHGDQGLSRIKVTIPEGTDIYDMAFILLKDIPGFDAPYFVKIAKPDEGYLFPDTYYFLQNVAPEDVVATMKENFDQKIQPLLPDIGASGRSLKNIIIMASIVEGEARLTDTRKVIAGILWKRLDQGLFLQVDAPLIYATSNTSGFVSLDDTKINSPYNTYKYKGLPIGPISNPGLDAIKATLHPTTTTYYYYLSDKNGVMHYAVTFEEHIANRQKYLN